MLRIDARVKVDDRCELLSGRQQRVGERPRFDPSQFPVRAVGHVERPRIHKLTSVEREGDVIAH